MHGLTNPISELDPGKLNEAFALPVLGCVAAWADKDYSERVLGFEGVAGEIDMAWMNVDGGAVSLGHPVGASGDRIVLHAMTAPKRLKLKWAIATECIGGGQGGAMLVERV
ncbi:hypothetical protein [Caulobacter sp. S45]|uniref:hypothetical protein n=1 Tax=Caulobacter sp. S45 TaxID=1641861 RepID=UPI001C2DEC70|nr:hypothetical protein [Caulobacter sp. S45]